MQCNLGLLSTLNYKVWKRPIRSVTIHVINSVLLITSMITERIGRHKVEKQNNL